MDLYTFHLGSKLLGSKGPGFKSQLREGIIFVLISHPLLAHLFTLSQGSFKRGGFFFIEYATHGQTYTQKCQIYVERLSRSSLYLQCTCLPQAQWISNPFISSSNQVLCLGLGTKQKTQLCKCNFYMCNCVTNLKLEPFNWHVFVKQYKPYGHQKKYR